MVRMKMPEEPSTSAGPSKKGRSSRKSKPYRPKVQDDVPAPKGIKIHEHRPPPKKQKDTPKGKGKKVVIASPDNSSDDNGDEFIVKQRNKKAEEAEKLVRQTLNVSKEEATKRMATKEPAAKLASKRRKQFSAQGMEASQQIEPSHASMDVPSQTQGTQPSDTTEEDFNPPEGYECGPLQPKDSARFNSYFGKRKICPAIYIDLEHMKTELKIDVDQFLRQYEPWIGSHLSYSPSVVRTFYCNLNPVDVVDNEGEVLEHRLETWVRGKQFELSATKVNQWLGIAQPPEDAFVERTVKETLAILKPEGDSKGLNFKPSSMSEEKRILWYIYSRAIVSKGNNFTSFTRRDYGLFASLVGKDVRNLGSMIMNELLLWRDNAIGTSSLPFPHLVSLFLKSNKIWYVDPSDEIVRVPRFGRTQISKMGLTVPTPDGEGEEKVRRKRKKPEGMDEVQSIRGATPEPPPSLEDIVNKVVQQALTTILSSHLHMMEHHSKEMQALFKVVDAGNTAMMELLRTQIEMTQNLSDRLTAFEALLHMPQSSPQPSPPSQPSQPTTDPTPSHPIEVDPEPHPFTHDISPKLPSPPISSGHVSPSKISQPSSPVPTTRSPVNTPTSGLLHHTDVIIDQVLTAIGQETTSVAEPTASVPATHPDDDNKGEEGKSEGKTEE